MNDNDYQPPEYQQDAFNCPHCKVLAKQTWTDDEIFLKKLFELQNQLFLTYRDKIDDYQQRVLRSFFNFIKPDFLNCSRRDFIVAECEYCSKFSIWVEQKMIYPVISTAPTPHPDMPNNVKIIYEEARSISHLFPRAAATLLRLSLEELTIHLEETKGSLNARIAKLRERGLPEKVIKSLDIVRITANEGGAHSGQIDLEGKDIENIVETLFFLVNFIVEKIITEPNKIDKAFDNLPDNKKQGIKNRDK